MSTTVVPRLTPRTGDSDTSTGSRLAVLEAESGASSHGMAGQMSRGNPLTGPSCWLLRLLVVVGGRRGQVSQELGCRTAGDKQSASLLRPAFCVALLT